MLEFTEEFDTFMDTFCKQVENQSAGIVVNIAFFIISSYKVVTNSEALINFLKDKQWSNLYVNIVIKLGFIVINLSRLGRSIVFIIKFIKKHNKKKDK